MALELDWQPIDTAPMDGTWVVVCCEGMAADVAVYCLKQQAWQTVENLCVDGHIGYESWDLEFWAPLPEMLRPLQH